MKVELPVSVVDACDRYNKMPRTKLGSVEALNLVAWLGEMLALLVSRERSKKNEEEKT